MRRISILPGLVAAVIGMGAVVWAQTTSRAAGTARGLYEHGPFSAGRCTVCHAAHEATRNPGLVAPEKELCFQCHQDLERELAVGYRHRVVREQPCSTCHDPHQSQYPHLLKRPAKELCLSCHLQVAAEGRRKSVHRPMADGECTACHAPHNSPYRQLLVEPLSDQFYGPFSTRRLALCFRCHHPDLARQAEGKASGFRNGVRNEHYLHVNDRVKGRACWVCHEPHGSDQTHLVRKAVPFGRWQLPIIFTEYPDGGACLCGCHKRLEYHRK